MLAVVAATALSYEQDRPHGLPSLHPAHDIRFDYAWTHKDDGPPEPRWRGQRVVGISQGTTGTHATFEAVSKLGLPAAHWFYQHRAGEEQRPTSIQMAKGCACLRLASAKTEYTLNWSGGSWALAAGAAFFAASTMRRYPLHSQNLFSPG